MNLHTAQMTPDWLSGIGTPLMETPCGGDPRFLDEFQRIKEEIDKLRDVDYAMIMATCRDLLTRVTKDLRVAGYHLVAAVYVDGLPGLLDSLRAYRTLLDNFWEDCHPLSESGRLAALTLLGNPRIIAFAELREEAAALETFEALQQEIDKIHSFLMEKLGEEAPRLSRLAPWVEERVRRLKSLAPATEDLPETAPDQPSSNRVESATQEVNSERGVETLTRQIHSYLINSGDLLRALAYSRAFRWGKLVPPPHEKNRTRIPPPRASGLAELTNIPSGAPLESTISCCETLFFEPGFHLLFELQFLFYQYLEANHRPDLAGFIRNALKDLLERHPQLSELQFDDGTPFAGSECRQWIQQCQMTGMVGGARAYREDEASDESEVAVIDQAIQLATRKKLPEALQSIYSLPTGTEKQRIRKRLTEARLCLAGGKTQMAEVVLEDIQKYILAHHLATWDPALAIEVLQQRLATLQTLEKNHPGEGKQHITQQKHEVRQLICKIDVIAAATII
jgi:type VI secretion system protein VasJ